MIWNYLKTIFRNIKRNHAYAWINIVGLSLGIATSLLIFIWIFNELSYDRFHEHSANVVRVIEKRHFPETTQYSSRTPGLLAPYLKNEYADVKETTRYAWTGERVVQRNDTKHYEQRIACVDPQFFSMFSFPFVHGNKESALNDLYSIVISEKIAEKYFGDKNPIGETLSIDNRFTLAVTGVIKDVPANSHLQFDMAVPFEMVEELGWQTDSWRFSMTSSYLRLNDKTDIKTFEKTIAGFIKNHDPETNIELVLQPLSKVHLYSNFNNPDSPGKIQYVWIFAIIGTLILLMACINYMNLATARSEKRINEVGVRKVLGATRKNLLWQFQLEAALLIFIAVIFVPAILYFFLPEFNKITGESFSFANFLNFKIFLILFGVAFFTGIVSASYPSIYLASFNPAKVFQNKKGNGSRAALRKQLVFVQITISLILIIVSTVFIRQIDFMKNKDLGFDKEFVLSIPLGISNSDNTIIYQTLKTQILQYPKVLNVTGAWTHPFRFGTSSDSVYYKGRRLDEDIPVSITSVDFDYIETFKINMLEGRSYEQERGSERGNWIVNEQFAELMGSESSLNQELKIGDSRGTIIGLMKDFHIAPVNQAVIGPIILFHHPMVNNIFVRIDPTNIPATLNFIEQEWAKVNPALPFSFKFLDEEFNTLFQDIENTSRAVKYFTVFSIFIACLGLFGLASFSAERRTKEIGIRKVLGASETNIVYLLCGDYIKLVFISILFSSPVAFFAMRFWLNSFPYRIPLQGSILVLSCLMILGVTVVTVGFHAVRAAGMNPVNSLKYE